MTIKEQLFQELENAPMPVLAEVLDFLRFLQSKQPKVDFMEFAGMASDLGDIMDEIVAEAEANRQLDLGREDRA
ncbi:hypothetical protein [Pseudanabaena sp. PCC 6802]|uniref:hypothetical protein n=1 Tax=Pseudanabaena sp. PCC 6802 TaxID=118173 RepID=UPI000345AE09|nr:hypothetical protein [Pseudanabaena sp. PCC 6802]